jgi:hypothetical protein
MIPVAARITNSDERLTLRYSSLLHTTVVIYIFYLSLLYYHCSNIVIAMSQLHMIIVTYNLLLQCYGVEVLDMFTHQLDGSDVACRHVKPQG